MTCVSMQVLQRVVSDYHKEHGTFPPTLAAAAAVHYRPELKAYLMRPVDKWGNRIWYESDGAHYILVSYGSDGAPDASDYWKLRKTAETRRDLAECKDPRIDLLATDLSFYRSCGKGVA